MAAAAALTTVTEAVAGTALKLGGSVAVIVIGPPTATPVTWNVALCWLARIVTVAGTVAIVGSLETSVTIVSVDCVMLIVAVSVAVEPTTTWREEEPA